MEERQMEKQPKVGTTFRWHTDKVLEYLRGVLAGGDAGLDRKRVYAADGDLCFFTTALFYMARSRLFMYSTIYLNRRIGVRLSRTSTNSDTGPT